MQYPLYNTNIFTYYPMLVWKILDYMSYNGSTSFKIV